MCVAFNLFVTDTSVYAYRIVRSHDNRHEHVDQHEENYDVEAAMDLRELVSANLRTAEYSPPRLI